MTTNQTIGGVPREFACRALSVIERLSANITVSGKDLKEGKGIAAELRALLDAPTEQFNPNGWSIDHSAGRPILMHNNCSVIEAEQAYGLLELIKTAAQPRGEPMFYLCKAVGAEWLQKSRALPWPYLAREVEFMPLYAEQPAPVAVVLPERMKEPEWDDFKPDSQAHEAACEGAKKFNECLDEVTRLNAKSR